MNYTIDKMHKEHIKNIEKKKKKKKTKDKMLIDLKKTLNLIENDINTNIIVKTNIRNKISKLERELLLIDSKYDELDYFDKSIDILVDYYSLSDVTDTTPNKTMEMNEMFDNNIFDNSKSTLHTRYLKNIKNINSNLNSNNRVCCNSFCDNKDLTLHISSGYFSCIECGYCEELIIEGDRAAYKESSNENSIYAYKRINHFNEWLSQFQGKESTDIPEELYDKIILELKKERIKDISSMSIEKMRKILKHLGYNKYYEHIPHILAKIGKKAPKISKVIEEKLRLMFKQIQEPFNIYCPKNRKNFLSYSYTLHKFSELLDLDDLAELFPMLKSRDKLKEQDILWSNICKHLKWQYIPSI